MKEIIVQKLHQIEEKEHVKILLAVESGSRAWGFASPDSDYDVRFIYVRTRGDYLRLDPLRDVIEQPINDLLDINGWDLKKALRLMYKSNPTLFEWLKSPIVYMETEFANEMRSVMCDYFSVKHSLYHYISMAEGNYKKYLRTEMVKAKKYFYVLRPLLAGQWILETGSPPPMLFSELMEAGLPDELRTEVEDLLEIKVYAPEVKMIPGIDRLNEYLEGEMVRLREKAGELGEEKKVSWEKLNEMFVKEV